MEAILEKTVDLFSNYNICGESTNKELDIYHLIFAPSFSCNMRCQHCYLPDSPSEVIQKETAIRVINEWIEIIRARGKFKGVFHIKGGEPFCLPYFWELVERISASNVLKLMITTNGTFNDQITLQKLSEMNLELNTNFTMVVSLDGATDESYSKLRGHGTFKKVLRFIESLNSMCIQFNINYVVNKHNFSEIEQIIELASKYNASQLNFLTLIPKGNASTIENWQVDHIKVFKKIKRIFDNSDDKIQKMLEGTIQDIRNKELNGLISTSHECVAAYKGLLYIVQNGDVYSCPNLVFDQYRLGNINNDSLVSLMNNTNNLYDKLNCFSGKYICSGEHKLYYDNNKSEKLNSLIAFQDHSKISSFKEDKLSFCYNRNH
jgi:radical SAM protein with 4Fe4S-binding SPASM domain